MRKVAMFDPKYCFLDVALEAKRIISPFTLEEIRDVSNGAAAFYNWVIFLPLKESSMHSIKYPLLYFKY